MYGSDRKIGRHGSWYFGGDSVAWLASLASVSSSASVASLASVASWASVLVLSISSDGTSRGHRKADSCDLGLQSAGTSVGCAFVFIKGSAAISSKWRFTCVKRRC